MARICTFLSDFGLTDSYVAEVKGIILSRAPEVQIIDITHLIAPQSVFAGALVLRNACQCYPSGTIHLAVVDPGVGTSRKAILIHSGGHYFVGPDNGLLDLASKTLSPNREFYEISGALQLQTPCSTFQGRDLFAPAVALILSEGGWSDFFIRLERIEPLALREPLIIEKAGLVRVDGEVISIDRFGNLMTNIAADLVPRRQPISIQIQGLQISEVGDNYLPPGRMISVIGSQGFLEISFTGGSAFDHFKGTVQIGTGVGLEYKRN